MPQVTNCLREDLELSYSSCSYLDYLIVFVCNLLSLWDKDPADPLSYKVVVALRLRARLLAYKREVKIKKLYCRKVLTWLHEEL